MNTVLPAAASGPATARSGPCAQLEPAAVMQSLQAALRDAGLEQSLADTHPYLFSTHTVFVTAADLAAMRAVVQAVEQVVAHPAYIAGVLGHAPAAARHDPGNPGAFLGFDFHLDPGGPKLIEINTNAGGLLLGLALLRAQLACCAPLRAQLPEQGDPERVEAGIVEMMQHEWRSAGRFAPIARMAIVDENPAGQFLYPEFVLFQKLFARHGIETVIAAPGELTIRDRRLWAAGQPVDLVYNRLTDFALEQPAQAVLREAWLANLAVVTPHPRAHALYADKRNLAILTNGALLGEYGIPGATIEVLRNGVAHTRLVDRAQADSLWAQRKGLFFKPVSGYGSKAVYRGDKLTRRVWEEILAGDYVAQSLVPPAEQAVGRETEEALLKYDVRNFAYRGQIQLLTARLYQGQTTNLRTPGGGFAPVFRASETARP